MPLYLVIITRLIMCKSTKNNVLAILAAFITFSGAFAQDPDTINVRPSAPIGGDSVEDFYRIIKTNKGENNPDIVGYLTDNKICGAKGAGMGAGTCAVIKATPAPCPAAAPAARAAGVANVTEDFYRIVEVNRGTLIPNFVSYLEDNSVCGAASHSKVKPKLKGLVSPMVGTKACAVIKANL